MGELLFCIWMATHLNHLSARSRALGLGRALACLLLRRRRGALSPRSGLRFEKRAQSGQIGEPVPLAGARILQGRPPDRAGVVALGVPQTKKVGTIPPRFGHRSYL